MHFTVHNNELKETSSNLFPYKVVGDTDVTVLTKTGIYSVKGTPTNAPTKCQGIAMVFSDVGTQFKLYIPDSEPYIYKYNSSSKAWFKFSGTTIKA